MEKNGNSEILLSHQRDQPPFHIVIHHASRLGLSFAHEYSNAYRVVWSAGDELSRNDRHQIDKDNVQALTDAAEILYAIPHHTGNRETCGGPAST